MLWPTASPLDRNIDRILHQQPQILHRERVAVKRCVLNFNCYLQRYKISYSGGGANGFGKLEFKLAVGKRENEEFERFKKQNKKERAGQRTQVY